MQHVAQPELVGVHAHFPGDHVHVRLDREGHLGLGRRPHVPAWNVVRVNHVAVYVDVGDHIRAACAVGPAQVDPGLERPVGPAVENGGCLARPQPAVALDPRLQGDHRRVPGVAGHKFLDVVHSHFHRPTGAQRQVIAKRNIHEGTLAPKVAADTARVELDHVLRDVPCGGHLRPEAEGRFIVDPAFHPAAIVNPDYAHVRLDVALVHQLGVESVLEDEVRLTESLLHVAVGPVVLSKNVVDLGHWPGQPGVAIQVRVKHRSVGFHGFQGIEHRRKLFVLHVNQQQRLFSYVGVFSGHGDNLFSHETDPVFGQNVDVFEQPAHQAVGQVLTREHRMDSRQVGGPGRVDSDNPGVWERAAQDLAGQQTRKGQVCRVSSAARYFVGALSPGYGLSDYREGGNHQDLHGEATLAGGLKFRLFRAYSDGLWVSIFRRPLTFSREQQHINGSNTPPAIFVATGIQSSFHRGERRVVFGSISPNTPCVLGVLCVEKPNYPSFSPQRESRALSPNKRDVGLQEWSRWDVDLSTRRA